jgi:ketosteroid isomerase-like protein
MCGPLIFALLAVSAAPVPEVVEVERLFAATVKEKGLAFGFRTFVADDGVIFIPDPRPGKELLEKAPDRPGTLEWWPVYAGVAASGDLGFTTGPYLSAQGERKGQGQYFTIWRKQPSGSWRWVLDHGPLTDEVSPLKDGAPLTTLPAGKTVEAPSQFSSWSAIEKAEAELAAALAVDAGQAYLAAFGEDARLMRQGPQPATGRTAVAAMLASQPKQLTVKTISGAVSKAGDLAYTYGDASWDTDAGPKRGHYVRIWQNRERGWTLVVDSIVPVQERKPS